MSLSPLSQCSRTFIHGWKVRGLLINMLDRCAPTNAKVVWMSSVFGLFLQEKMGNIDC